MRSGVVFFEQEIKIPVTLYKRGGSYQEKPIAFRLVRVVGSHYFKDGKGSIDLNEVALTGVPLFREDVPLKKSQDKNAVVCISLELCKPAEELEAAMRSHKHASTAPPTRLPDANRTGLRINAVHVPVSTESDSPDFHHTPVTAGPTSTYYSPDTKGSDWSPVSAQISVPRTQFSSPNVVQVRRSGVETGESPGTDGSMSPVSAPLKSILSQRDSRKDVPVLKKSVSLKFDAQEEKPESPLLKLIKVEETLEDEDLYEKKWKVEQVGSSGSEEEAPSPATEHRNEEELSDGEKQTREAQERKRAFRLDLSKAEVQPQQTKEFTNGEDTSSDEEPIVVKSPAPPVTLMKNATPNKQSKEKALAAEEQKTGLPATRERSTVCHGCSLQ